MSPNSFKITNYFVTFAVFAMVAVAVIAAQARTTGEAQNASVATLNTRLLPEQFRYRHLEVVPVVVNSLLDLPIQIDVNTKTGTITASRKTGNAGNE